MASLLRGLRTVNYYPRARGWSRMWSDWDPAALNADLARIAGLNANAVRLIVHPWTFGFPAPAPVMRERLSEAIRLADAHGLRVQLTLFDLWSDFADVPGSRRWLDAIVPPLAGDPRIATIELANEIDPRRVELSWARRMLPYLRERAGGIPVTVSLAGDQGADGLRALREGLGRSQPTYYDLHFYGGRWGERAYSALYAARAAVAPVPLHVGETGASTVAGRDQEFDQDHFLRTVQWATRALALGTASPWTLDDFEPGAIPFAADPMQHHMGLFDAAGRPKRSAATVARVFAGERIDAGFNGSFERHVASPGGGTRPAEWGVWRADSASFARDTRVARTGGASARIAAARGDRGGVPAFYVAPIEQNLVRGRAYRARAWVRRASATGQTTVALAWFDARGTYLGQAESPAAPTGTGSWTALQVVARAPSGAASVQIHLKSRANTGTMWFDDVDFGSA